LFQFLIFVFRAMTVLNNVFYLDGWPPVALT
jgi:hypothetical protein